LLITAAALTPARAQWTEPVRIGAPGGILYPQILAQGDTLHVVYSNNDQEWKIGYIRSTDRGGTWSDQQVLSRDSSETLFVRIVQNGSRLMVLWRNNYYNGGTRPRNIGFNISSDNGLTWSGPEYVLDPSWEHILYFSASGSGPVVNVVLSSRISPDLVFFTIRSTDFGQSWSEPVELFRAAECGSTDQAGSNAILHYLWSGNFSRQDPWETYYIRSTDNGVTWSENVNLTEVDQYHSYWPSISVNDIDYAVFSWMDYKYSPYWFSGDIFVRGSFDLGENWFREREVTYNHRALRSDVAMAMDTIHLAWEDVRPNDGRRGVYYSRSIDFGIEWSEETRLDQDSAESRNPGLATSNGRVYAVWADGSEESGFGLYFSRYDEETRIVDDRPVLADMARLRVYPNPFNFNVAIYLDMQKGGESGITIYDVNGRLVKSIFKGGNLEKGTHKFTWDATDASGKAVSSGLYFAVASTPQGKLTEALTLIR
jgi:hypothetical protein